MTIAVDFDGTLCKECYPEIGEPNVKLINMLKKRQLMGDKLILWTCRGGEPLIQAIAWCMSQGLVFDAINDNLPENIKQWGDNSRKVSADIYIDDRSQLPWNVIIEAVG